MASRSSALASRVEQGAELLAKYLETITDAEWKLTVPKDNRPVGVVAHHVASMYPIEVHVAQVLASGKPLEGVTFETEVRDINAKHAHEHATATRTETIALLRKLAGEAAEAIRKFTDAELDQAAPVSLNDGAPLTCQFLIEDHALRHSWHHATLIRRTVEAARAKG